MNYKSRYSGEQVDAFLEKAAKMGVEIDYIKNNTPIIDTGVTLDDTRNLNIGIKLFKKDGTEATDARDVYSGFLKFNYLFETLPFAQDIMILQNIMEEGVAEYKEVHQIVFMGANIYKRTVHVDCGDFDANGERTYPITQENYDEGDYNTGFYSALWNDDLLDRGRIAEAIDKAIKESGGGGSSDQSDYNQNDPTKADYIKNRPFCVEKVVIEIPLSGSTPEEDYVEFPCAELASLEGSYENPLPIEVEIDDNGSIYKGKFYFLEGYTCDANNNDAWLDSGRSFSFAGMDNECIFIFGTNEPLEGVTVRISYDNIKTIDKKALPPNDVPYIYSEESLFGCVCLPDLASGVYVLHGCFDITRGDMYTITYFEEKPILCHVWNVDGNIKLFWFDATENGFIGRYMNIYEGEIVNDEFFEWEGIMAMLDDAYTLASEAQTWAEDANAFAADATGTAEEAYCLAEAAYDLGTETKDTIGDIDEALDAILSLDEEFMTPNGDEVKY